MNFVEQLKDIGRRLHVLSPLPVHFIHIPKNAGTSIRKSLKGRASMTDPFHQRYRDVAPSLPSGTRCLAVVRNPWSRTFSRFMYAMKSVPKWTARGDPRAEYFSRLSFERFILEHREVEIPRWPGQPWLGPHGYWGNQLDYVCDEYGVLYCDMIRFEYLGWDLSRYFQVDLRIPRTNASCTGLDYRQAYTPLLIQKVADIYADDIRIFGFEFEGPARWDVWSEGDLRDEAKPERRKTGEAV